MILRTSLPLIRPICIGKLLTFPPRRPRWGNVRKADKGGAASGEEKAFNQDDYYSSIRM